MTPRLNLGRNSASRFAILSNRGDAAFGKMELNRNALFSPISIATSPTTSEHAPTEVQLRDLSTQTNGPSPDNSRTFPAYSLMNVKQGGLNVQ